MYKLHILGRILGIDYGLKRSGLAVTDPLRIIVNGLDTVDTAQLMPYLEKYLLSEAVDIVVIGMPVHRDGNFTALKPVIEKFAADLRKKFSHLKIEFADEQFTSVEARERILQYGIKKEKRRDKALIDQVSAVIILQRYLNFI